MSTLGPLVPADETFNHQIVDTFASVGQTDRSWTEKVCAMACARDGSLQLGFGLGKYTNRNVMDGYAGASMGVQQWTVRASRALAPDPGTTSVGPLHYEVLEPYRTVRFALEPNDVVPVSFEWVFTAAVPPVLERHEQHRSADGYRLDADIARYHQIGVGSGWAEVDGRRVELADATWVSTRDHSWGVRYMVGAPVADVPERPMPDGLSILTVWSPMLCERADGSRYGIHLYYQRHLLGSFRRLELQGGIEHPDGRREDFVAVEPDLRFDDVTRRFRGGTLHCTMPGGEERPIAVRPITETGFALGAGLYFGFDGHWHGQWRGRLHVDGEHIPDISTPDQARRVHQLRDCVISVDDPVGGGRGWGNLQSLATGPHPESGLTAEASFM
jgi:hypothetical protein